MEEIDIYFNKKTAENQRFTNIVELEVLEALLHYD